MLTKLGPPVYVAVFADAASNAQRGRDWGLRLVLKNSRSDALSENA
jgi:hypothetical protein